MRSRWMSVSAAARAPFWLTDEAAVDGRHAGERVDAHRVVERHDAERALAPCVAALQRLGDGAGVVVALRARHALGPSGGPRGVEDQGEIALGSAAGLRMPRVARLRQDRRTAPCPRAQRRRADEDQPHVAAGARRRARPARCRPQAAPPGRRSPRACSASRRRRARKFTGAGTRGDELQRPVREDVLEAVAQRDEDAVAGGDAEAAERAADARGRASSVGVGPGGAAPSTTASADGPPRGGQLQQARQGHDAIMRHQQDLALVLAVEHVLHRVRARRSAGRRGR